MFSKLKQIPDYKAAGIVKRYHYAKGIGRGVQCIAGVIDGRIAGVVVFATPISESVRRSVAGPDYTATVYEIRRVALCNNVPNMASALVCRAIKVFKKLNTKVRYIISYADTTQGHVGYMYQACNFVYAGMTAETTFYVDAAGALRHPRQCGQNITKQEALNMGWSIVKRKAKHRYVTYASRSKAERKRLVRDLKWVSQPYPKGNPLAVNKE